MSSENVVNLNLEKKFTKEQELYGRIHDLIHEYDGDVSVVSVIGVLELVKDHVKACSA